MDFPELNHEDYDRLVEQYLDFFDDEDEVRTHWLQAVDPNQLFSETWNEPERRGLLIQRLNVHKPHLYRTRTGSTRVIIPVFEDTTYDMLDIIWPAQVSPFAFVIRDTHYDTMGETEYYFRWGLTSTDGKQPLPKFEKDNYATH